MFGALLVCILFQHDSTSSLYDCHFRFFNYLLLCGCYFFKIYHVSFSLVKFSTLFCELIEFDLFNTFNKFNILEQWSFKISITCLLAKLSPLLKIITLVNEQMTQFFVHITLYYRHIFVCLFWIHLVVHLFESLVCSPFLFCFVVVVFFFVCLFVCSFCCCCFYFLCLVVVSNHHDHW